MLEIDLAPFIDAPVTEYADILNKIGYVLFMIATVLTVTSGISYMRKYQQVFSETEK